MRCLSPCDYPRPLPPPPRDPREAAFVGAHRCAPRAPVAWGLATHFPPRPHLALATRSPPAHLTISETPQNALPVPVRLSA